MSTATQVVHELIQAGDYMDALEILESLIEKNGADYHLIRHKIAVIKYMDSPAMLPELERCLLKAHELDPANLQLVTELSYHFTCKVPNRQAAERFERLFQDLLRTKRKIPELC